MSSCHPLAQVQQAACHAVVQNKHLRVKTVAAARLPALRWSSHPRLQGRGSVGPATQAGSAGERGGPLGPDGGHTCFVWEAPGASGGHAQQTGPGSVQGGVGGSGCLGGTHSSRLSCRSRPCRTCVRSRHCPSLELGRGASLRDLPPHLSVRLLPGPQPVGGWR